MSRESVVVAIWILPETALTGTSDLWHIGAHCNCSVIQAPQAAQGGAPAGFGWFMLGLHALFAEVMLWWKRFNTGSD